MLRTELDYYISFIIASTIMFLLSFVFQNSSQKNRHIISLFFITLLSIFIGSRNMNIGTDTEVYYYMYRSIDSIFEQNVLISLWRIASEPIFFCIIFIFSKIGDFNTVLIAISFITLSFGYIFCVRLCEILNSKNALALLCCYLVSFYVFQEQINIIRAGLAATILLNYYISLFKNKKRSAIIWGILALGIHFTSIIGILLGAASKLLKPRNKLLFILFFFTLALSFVNIGILNIGFLNFDLGAKSSYLSGAQTTYITGFRAGFALFNTIFLLFFHYISQKSNLFELFFRLFVFLSCLFFLSFQIPFSDRIGAFSWNIISSLSFICILRNHSHNQSKALLFTFILMLATSVGVNIIS